MALKTFPNSVPGAPHAPITDQSGNVTLPWYQFFVSLWNRTGGAAGSISTMLDQIASSAGSILIRGAGQWLGLDPGSTNTVLQIVGGLPAWGLISGANFAKQGAGLFFAGPASGANSDPIFRSIVSPDLVGAAGQFPATATNDNAAVNHVGEFNSASASAIALTTATAKDVVSLALTAGDWDIWGSIGLSAAVNPATAWISATSATDPGAPNGGAYLQLGPQTAATFSPVGTMRISLATSATLHLSTKATFSSAVNASGVLAARRAR